MTKALSSYASATVACGLLAAFLLPSPAQAIPSFSAQTGQPCSACHVGAFGPQLKPYGRDFKLHGYVASDRPDDDDVSERLSVMARGSFNRTDANNPQPPTHYGPNDNFSFDQASLYYGGRLTQTIGGLQEISYDGVNRNFFWDAADFRHAHEGDVLGKDYVLGAVFSNQLGNTSVWNSGTPNGFPYNSSSVAPTPQAGTLFDNSLNGQIAGLGLYGLWNDLVYAEGTMYVPLAQNFQHAAGTIATLDGNTGALYQGVIPYWHLALQHDFDHHAHYIQLGTYGAVANRSPGDAVSPGGDTVAGNDHLTDLGLEANYQYLADLDNVVSFHASFVNEQENLTASHVLLGTNPNDHLRKFNADVTYAIMDTYVPTIQYFKTTGSSDAALYTNASSPNSEGYTVELAYVPFGRPDSYIQNGNVRLALQYTGYTQFDGTSRHASDNNTLFLNLWMTLAPFKVSFGEDK